MSVQIVWMKRRVAAVKMRKQTEDSELGRQLQIAWLRQLQAEYEDICYQYRLDLQLPIFELDESRTRLGSWQGHSRLLSISTHLISNNPWQITLQVLKHEIAHQICTEIFFAPNEGHGVLFQQACDLLGLAPSFRGANADCQDGLPTEGSCSIESENGRKVLAKVEKLLALAGSDNEHEASLAMQRAGELLKRHNLQTMTERGQQAYRHLTLNTGRQRMPGYLRSVCSLLQSYFFVRVVCASLYEPALNVHHRTIELFGRPENVVVAEHCYLFLTDRLDFLWKKNRNRFKGNRQRARNSYFLGIVAGFKEKLAAAEPKSRGTIGSATASAAALAVIEDIGLTNFIANRFPRLRKSTGREIRLDAEAYRDAVNTGKELILHRAVEETRQGGELLEWGG